MSRLPDVLRRGSWPVLLAAALCSGVATYLSTADAVVPALAWVAPIPVLAFAFATAGRIRLKPDPTSNTGTVRGVRLQADSTGARRVRLAAAAFLAGLGGNLAWAVLYRGILPVAPLVAFAALFGAAVAVAVWLTAWAAERRGAWAGVLLFPSLWVAFELAVSRWSPHGTAGSLAYSQVDLIPLIQVAAWTGLAGVTFIVSFVAAGTAATIGVGPGTAVRWRLLAVPAVVLLLVFAFGTSRVSRAGGERMVLVGLASIDDGMRHSAETRRDKAMPVANEYLEAGRALATRRLDAIVMPEKMVGVAPDYEDELSTRFSALAEDGQVLVIAGLNLVGRARPRNVAAVFSRGSRVLDYDKRHLVPGLESMYLPGEKAGLYRAPGGLTGIAVCKDLDFPALGREYSQAGIGILFVPAWDFTRDARLHSRMAVMRGVEGGYSIARAAADGFLTGSDPLGQVIAERPSWASRPSMVIAPLPFGRGKTFYAEYGDWFGWTCLVAAALVLFVAAIARP